MDVTQPQPALPASVKEKGPTKSREVAVSVPKVVFGNLICLFFGKRAAACRLRWTLPGHPSGSCQVTPMVIKSSMILT